MNKNYVFRTDAHKILKVWAESLEAAQHKLSTATVDGQGLGAFHYLHEEN